ncbi:RrF2 family transcriptional regulator [Deinococcus radiophilus]|uniref:Rrf2 family transcriptional regulator n=1 Tax=Deinococcus radiophilus TaxID=32062 RepID=A0A3S0K4K0_9DEIO|nr:Rrf2 family transcriptional regulator [Deinococcus radiophilus]RTR19745.1 Rrf2 family transcriptional regulator [Deinococcus radiophilus]UFA51838.1 Rrf2 family transcriptional regulator [Deinococcus radiophilus]
MFSQTAEYALRAVTALAEAAADMAASKRSSLSAAELAARTQVPAQYLSKVMQQLTRAEVVTAQRGKYGGYCLSRSPQDIRLLDVVNAVDPVSRILKCPLDRPEHAHALCPLHREMDAALAEQERRLAGLTLACLLPDRPQARLSLPKSIRPA